MVDNTDKTKNKKQEKIESKKETKKEDSKSQSKKDNLKVVLVQIGQTFATIRNRPLLLMFYSNERSGSIKEEDILYLEEMLKKDIPEGVKELDVIIQTRGGEANTSYLLAQLIRDYCSEMEIFIPYHSYSGGTLIALASSLIHLGRTARLSPIDIQLPVENAEQFSLVSIEKYVEFIADTCNKFNFKYEENKTKYIIPLMEKLIEDIGTVELGKLFRLRTLSEYHAGILLHTYMFKNEPNRTKIIEYIIDKLTASSPDHSFEIDLHIAKGINLKVDEMDGNLYKLSRQLISICGVLKREGEICQFQSDMSETRNPFFMVFFPQKEEVKQNVSTNNNS